MQAVFVRLHPAAACNILSLEDKRDKTWGLVLSNCACSRMFTSWKNGEIMQTNDWKMQVRERHKEQVQKKTPKKNNWEMQLWKKQTWEMEKKCKSDPGPTGQTWFRKKSCKSLGKSKQNAKKTRKMQQKCKKMQIRPGTKLDKRDCGKKCKTYNR